jgi:TPR repeat protein
MAAAENGSKEAQAAADTVRADLAKLPANQRQSAYDVLMRYGAKSMQQNLLPAPRDLLACLKVRPVGRLETVVPEYPETARRTSQNADVYIQFTVGIDGLAREPEALSTFPAGEMFVRPAMRAVLLSQFRPAELDSRPIELTDRLRIKFRIAGGGNLWDHAGVRRAMDLAEKGNPAAQFLIGSAASVDPAAFQLTAEKARDFVIKAAQAGNPAAQYWIAGYLAEGGGACAKSAKVTRWLNVAVQGENPAAQVDRARQLLRSEPSATEQAEAKRLLVAAAKSNSVFAMRHAVGILATSPVEGVRDLAFSAAAVRKFATADYEDDPQTWEVLAASQAAGGNFSDAVRQQQKAIRLAAGYRWNTSAMSERLAAYEAKTVWRGDLLAVPPAPDPGPPPSKLARCRDSLLVLPCVRPAE